MSDVTSNVGNLRRARGISAVQLAEAAGVTRQTIYAIEAGTYIPNTMVSLRLARALEATVEELFSLSDPRSGGGLRAEIPTLLPGSGKLAIGQGVQLCRVDDKLFASSPSPLPWLLPLTDGVVIDRANRAKQTAVNVFQPGDFFEDRLLIAGCDPGISILARHAQNSGVQMVLAHRNSSQSLSLLEQGCVHLAGTHLRDDSTGESNLSEVRQRFRAGSVAIISFAVWEQGLLLQPGNPKAIKGVEDLVQRGVSIVNREEGSGSRALLNSQLAKLQINARRIRGFDNLASGHLAAAWQVHSGAVDCCVATQAAARVYGLHFVPLVSERYDLVMLKKYLSLSRMQSLLNVLSRSDFRRELDGFGGYDSKVAGRRLE